MLYNLNIFCFVYLYLEFKIKYKVEIREIVLRIIIKCGLQKDEVKSSDFLESVGVMGFD